MAKATKRFPLLSVGTFGVHLLLNPAGRYSFLGSVPGALSALNSFETEAEGLAAFVTWFKGMDADEQREHVGNLRADVFTLVFETPPAEPAEHVSNPLFALWAVDADGQPTHADAWQPWGDRDPLAYVGEPDAATLLGPWCTIVDQDTERLVWAGNITEVLEAYVAEVERELGYVARYIRGWEGEGTALIAAVAKARAFAAERAADEYGAEAARDWCEPNPDTSRSIRRMPEQVRSNIGEVATAEGLSMEAERVAQMILTHAGLSS